MYDYPFSASLKVSVRLSLEGRATGAAIDFVAGPRLSTTVRVCNAGRKERFASGQAAPSACAESEDEAASRGRLASDSITSVSAGPSIAMRSHAGIVSRARYSSISRKLALDSFFPRSTGFQSSPGSFTFRRCRIMLELCSARSLRYHGQWQVSWRRSEASCAGHAGVSESPLGGAPLNVPLSP